MTPQEKQYRSTVTRLGVAMLIMLGCLLLYGTVMAILALVVGTDTVFGNVVTELVGGVMYALSFVLPVPLFYVFSKGERTLPLSFRPTLPRHTLAFVFVAMALISAASEVNYILLDLFGYFDGAATVTNAVPPLPYEYVLQLFTVVIVPAFVEELLFRGLVLRNLLPFGKITAVVISAVLFGLMHQNPQQLLYTTVAGLILGFVYVYTESIWCCVLIHFCNNFVSMLHSLLLNSLPKAQAIAVLHLTELIIYVVGAVGAVWLLCRHKKPAVDPLQTGAFEVDLPRGVYAAELPVAPARCFKLFFSVPMLIFVIASVLLMYATAMLI